MRHAVPELLRMKSLILINFKLPSALSLFSRLPLPAYPRTRARFIPCLVDSEFSPSAVCQLRRTWRCRAPCCRIRSTRNGDMNAADGIFSHR